MISGRSDSLHVHTVSPPTATGRPDGLRNQGVANDAAGSPVAGGLDLTAADLGADAADLAHEINPSGSTAGRDRLADAITGRRLVTLTVFSVRDGGNYLGVRCEPEYQHGLRIGDFIVQSDIEYVVCDIDQLSFSGLVFITIKRTQPVRPIKEKHVLTFAVGGKTGGAA